MKLNRSCIGYIWFYCHIFYMLSYLLDFSVLFLSASSTFDLPYQHIFRWYHVHREPILLLWTRRWRLLYTSSCHPNQQLTRLAPLWVCSPFFYSFLFHQANAVIFHWPHVNHYKACIFMIWVVCCRCLVTTVVGDAMSKAPSLTSMIYRRHLFVFVVTY